MTDINKLVEEEAERYALEQIKIHHSDITSMKAKFEYTSIINDFKVGANIALHQNRWRKFATDDLPKIGQQIVCKSSSWRYHLFNPISNNGIYWLAENFIEWKHIE